MLTAEDTPETPMGHEDVKRGRGRPRKYPEHAIDALFADDAEAGGDMPFDAASTLDAIDALLDADYPPTIVDTEAPNTPPAPCLDHAVTRRIKHANTTPPVEHSIMPVRRLAYRPDGLPMGEIDPKACGANGLLWGQRDPCDIVSLDQATGWFECDAARWEQWKTAARAGLAEAMLERAHILYRKRRGQAEKTLTEKQWDVVCILARLVHGYVLEGRQTQYADPQYDSALLKQTGTIIPTSLTGAGLDTKTFPFKSGTRVKTQFNPWREVRVSV